jgi:hypothetical protein
MNRLGASAAWWGFFLVGWAALWLVDATVVARLSPMVFAIFFGVAGGGFAVMFARDAGSWWAAIPAGALIGLGALIAFVVSTTAPDVWGASILLAGSGVGFGAVFVRRRDQPWTLIPAGALISVAIIVASVPFAGRGEMIGVVVLGSMAALLVVLALVPIRGRRMLWPLVPAAILGVIAGFLAADAEEALEPFNWVLPAALLVVGIAVLILSRRGTDRQNP